MWNENTVCFVSFIFFFFFFCIFNFGWAVSCLSSLPLYMSVSANSFSLSLSIYLSLSISCPLSIPLRDYLRNYFHFVLEKKKCLYESSKRLHEYGDYILHPLQFHTKLTNHPKTMPFSSHNLSYIIQNSFTMLLIVSILRLQNPMTMLIQFSSAKFPNICKNVELLQRCNRRCNSFQNDIQFAPHNSEYRSFRNSLTPKTKRRNKQKECKV